METLRSSTFITDSSPEGSSGFAQIIIENRASKSATPRLRRTITRLRAQGWIVEKGSVTARGARGAYYAFKAPFGLSLSAAEKEFNA